MAGKCHTHYSVAGATWIDRIYATQEVLARKLGVEAVVAPFTDHLAVCLHISSNLPVLLRGRGLWKLDSTVLIKHNCTEKLCYLWEHLKR
jgi:hypothetical protein